MFDVVLDHFFLLMQILFRAVHLFFCAIFYNIFSDAYERVERQDDDNKQRKNQKYKERKK
jgi:hypothetical protein